MVLLLLLLIPFMLLAIDASVDAALDADDVTERAVAHAAAPAFIALGVVVLVSGTGV